jgi:hypothetical protein
VDLPTQYAVVRNVVREVEARIGQDEWRRLGYGVPGGEGSVHDEARRGFVMWDSGVGSALWYAGNYIGISPDVITDIRMTACNRAVSDSYTLLPSDTVPEPTSKPSSASIPIDYIQGSRHMLEMTRNLFEDAAEAAEVRYQRVDKQLGIVSNASRFNALLIVD